MEIQINSALPIEEGKKLEFILTGIDSYDATSDDIPTFDIKMVGEDPTEEFLVVIPPPAKTTAGLDTAKDLVAEHPQLLKGEAVVGVVGEQQKTDPWFNAYAVRIIGKNEGEKRLKAMGTMETLDLTIKGSLLQHPAKINVIEQFEEGKETVVEVSFGKTGEPIVVFPEESKEFSGGVMTAGEIIYADDQRETLVKILAKKSPLEAVVFNSDGHSYQARVGVETEEFEAFVAGKDVETVETVMADIHTTIGTPMATLEDIHVYLKSQSIPNKHIKALLRKIRNYDDSVVAFIPEKPRTAYQDNKGLLARAVAYLLGGESVLMSGDAATGKNLMAETLCWLIQKPYRFYSISIQTDKFDLTGRTVLNSHTEGGGTRVQDSFLVSMMKHGGAILLDEINASNPAIMTVLHSVVEKGHKMIDVESSDERVVAKDDFVLFGAMNPGYAGTGDLNEALHSRFATLNFGKNDDILGLLQVHHESKDAPIEMLQQVNQLYGNLFENVREGQLNAKVLSFRRYAAAVKYAAEGVIPLKEALIDNVANMVLDPFENEIICDAIDSHIG